MIRPEERGGALVKLAGHCVFVEGTPRQPTAFGFPTTDLGVQELMATFQQRPDHHMPHCIGAVDGTIVHMAQPISAWSYRYWNYKHSYYGLLLLAVVDGDGLFLYISAGHPGCTHDSTAFRDTLLYKRMLDGTLLPPSMDRNIEGVMVPPYFVADSAFRLMPFVMKDYDTEPSRNSPEYSYNHHHFRTRRVVENAFGRLKGRWLALRTMRIRDVHFMTRIIQVCAALHNMCQRSNDGDPTRHWFFNETHHHATRAQHPASDFMGPIRNNAAAQQQPGPAARYRATGVQVRQAITTYLHRNFPPRI